MGFGGEEKRSKLISTEMPIVGWSRPTSLIEIDEYYLSYRKNILFIVNKNFIKIKKRILLGAMKEWRNVTKILKFCKERWNEMQNDRMKWITKKTKWKSWFLRLIDLSELLLEQAFLEFNGPRKREMKRYKKL